MSLAQSTVVQRVRIHLGDMPWESAGTASSTTSVIAVTDGTDWSEGDIGELIDVTTGVAETFYVSSVSSNNLTAVRGYYGSVAAAHVTSSRILKNPKYRTLEITNAIDSIINWELPWPRIYKVVSDSITPATSTTEWYDLAADALGLVSVYQLSDNTPVQRRKYGRFHQFERVSFERNLPTALCASGVGVRFPDGFLDDNNTVSIKYAAKITDTITTAAYDDLTDGDAVVEAIIFGTVALLQGSLELRKPRKSAQETDNLRPASYFAGLFTKALTSAEKELRSKSPLMPVKRDI